MLIRHYYHENVSLSELLSKHVVGVVRKPSHGLSFLSRKITKKQLFVCFNYKGIRTFGTFIKEKENNIEYYTMETLGIP